MFDEFHETIRMQYILI